MFVSFGTKQISILGEEYPWVDSEEIGYAIKERVRIASDVTAGKILFRIRTSAGEELQGQEAVNQIPYLAICYRLSSNPAKKIVRPVLLNTRLGVKGSCIEAIKKWRVIEQRNLENGEMVEASYFDSDHQIDWVSYKLPEAQPA